MSAPDQQKPLRRDAERNRRRILQAAREVFSERGLEVTLDDIAEHAGLGVGTVYRRFPSKNELIDALFAEEVDTLVGVAEGALAIEDPWEALSAFFERMLEEQTRNRGLKEVMLGSDRNRERVAGLKARFKPLSAELVARAHASGQLREDFIVFDMPMLQILISSIIEPTRDVEPELWRRYLHLLLEGMRARPDNRPIPQPPLEEDQVPAVMAAWRPPKR